MPIAQKVFEVEVWNLAGLFILIYLKYMLSFRKNWSNGEGEFAPTLGGEMTKITMPIEG